MSTLTMALAAALLAGSAPEKVSTETKEAPSPLRFNGHLSGTFNGSDIWNAPSVPEDRGERSFYWTCGRGNQGGWTTAAGVRRNGFHNQKGAVTLGLCLDKKVYSASLRLGQEEWSFTLHHVKPGK